MAKQIIATLLLQSSIANHGRSIGSLVAMYISLCKLIFFAALRTATGLDRDITPEERRHWGRIIAAALQYYLVQLINTIDLHKAANYLFGARIISDNQYDMATKEVADSTKNRAGKLIVVLIGKLEANPHMFGDICIAFEQAGAESIVNEIKGKLN